MWLRDGARKNRRCSTSQSHFPWSCQHMGGLDLMDQCVAIYPHRRRSKRWYIRVFFHFLDATTVNAWHLYRMSGSEQKDPLHFKASTACVLINAGAIKTFVRGRPSATLLRWSAEQCPRHLLRSSLAQETTGPIKTLSKKNPDCGYHNSRWQGYDFYHG